METNGELDRKKVFQNVLSWAIVIIFVFFATDWQSVSEYSEKRSKNHIFKGSPEYEPLFREIFQIQDQIKKAAEEKTLTAEETVKAQNRVIEICDKIEISHGVSTTFIFQTFREMFLRNWKLPENAPEYMKERCADDYDRRKYAEQDFQFEINGAIGKYRPAAIDYVSRGDVKDFFLWLFKWYYLFTIPTLLIVLMNMIFAGKSLAEKLWFDGWRIGLACLGGPIGVSLISESAGEIKRYQKLKAQYLDGKDYWHLSKKEEEAIWIQVMEPYLQFGEALKKVGTVTVRKPAIVCFVLWFLSLSMSTFAFAKSQQPEIKIENVAEAGTLEVAKEKTIQESPVKKLLVDNVIIVDQQLDFPKIEISGKVVPKTAPILKKVFLIQTRPRGPPNPTAGRNANDSDNFLLTATSRKGERT